MGLLNLFRTSISPDWIDYNGHMQDAYYGLIFSYAVDAFQDYVGFDAVYRKKTGCTIYLLEEHKFFLKEVLEGQIVDVQTALIGLDEKRFHLHMHMLRAGQICAVCEVIEMHVNQHPKPHGATIPTEIHAKMHALILQDDEISALRHRAREMGIK